MINSERLSKKVEVHGKMFLRRLKYEWRKWDEKTYERSKEVRVKIDWKKIESTKNFENLVWNVQDPDFIRFFSRYVAVLMVFITLFTDKGLIDKVKEYGGNPNDINVVLMYLLGMYFPYVLKQTMDIKARKIANELFPELLDIPEIRENFQKYKYFYLNDSLEIIFTNTKPPALIRFHHRQETNDTWGKDYRPKIIERVLDGVGAVGWNVYIRAFYPYFLSPIQLNFREYDSAAKRLNLKEGDNVLILGAGPVPHHVRWKKRLGVEGKITALDYDQNVIGDSARIESTIDRAHKLVRGVNRTETEYVHGDANDLSRFPDNSFDAIAAIRCYTYSVEDAMRVLKPGGKFMIYQGGTPIPIPKNFPYKIQSFWNGVMITKIIDNSNEGAKTKR